ncbi:MAG: hypothetical protein HW384_2118, partial [Dehalococcoidia bacterium]|nr:hypothetical protein [Dehalococcoidia bacterium]
MRLEGLHEVVLAILLLVALVEITRRLMGIAVTTILLIFIIYPMVSAYAPGFLHGRGLNPT